MISIAGPSPDLARRVAAWRLELPVRMAAAQAVQSTQSGNKRQEPLSHTLGAATIILLVIFGIPLVIVLAPVLIGVLFLAGAFLVAIAAAFPLESAIGAFVLFLSSALITWLLHLAARLSDA